MGRRKLNLPRVKLDFVLRLEIEEERIAADKIERLKQAGLFQDWIRDLVVNALLDDSQDTTAMPLPVDFPRMSTEETIR